MKKLNKLTLFPWPNDKEIKKVIDEILCFYSQSSVLLLAGGTIPVNCQPGIKLIIAYDVSDIKTLRAWHSIQITGIKPVNDSIDARMVRPCIVIQSKLLLEEINLQGPDLLKNFHVI
jgi:hypothetical protein